MADPRPPEPALLVIAAFSRHRDLLDRSQALLEVEYGPLARRSPDWSFHQTAYYQPTMGAGLVKRFLAFERLVAPDRLPPIKLRTNALEEELARERTYAEPRPINLDPGLLSLGKFLLATTKDQAHRIYLGEGIFAEVTLRFQAGSFEPWPWTYADYREPYVIEFINEVRSYYRSRVRGPKEGERQAHHEPA